MHAGSYDLEKQARKFQNTRHDHQSSLNHTVQNIYQPSQNTMQNAGQQRAQKTAPRSVLWHELSELHSDATTPSDI